MGRPRRSARDVQATSMRIDWDGRPAIVTTFRDLTNVKAATLLKYQAALLDHVSDAIIGVTAAGGGHQLECRRGDDLRPQPR